jgi:hypothetical protein
MTRRALNACWVSTRPAPLSGCCASPRRCPQNLAWHARREGRCRADKERAARNPATASAVSRRHFLVGSTRPSLTGRFPAPTPSRQGSRMAGDATAREREHERGVAAHDLSLILLGEYRPCPRPLPRQHAWARQGVKTLRPYTRYLSGVPGVCVSSQHQSIGRPYPHELSLVLVATQRGRIPCDGTPVTRDGRSR